MATTAIASTQSQPAERVDYRRLLWVAPLAALAAAIANLVVYFIADAAGAYPDGLLLPNGQAMGPAPVISTSVIGVVGAALVYAAIGRFAARRSASSASSRSSSWSSPSSPRSASRAPAWPTAARSC